MRIVFTKAFSGMGLGNVWIGRTVDLPDAHAKRFLTSGLAERAGKDGAVNIKRGKKPLARDDNDG